MRKFSVIFSLIGLVIATSLGITFWSAIKNDKNAPGQHVDKETAELEKAEQLIASDQIEEALPIIQKFRSLNNSFSPNAAKWTDLYVKANEKERDIPELILLFDYYPEAFKNNEEAALLIANEFILHNKDHEYQSLRSIMKGQEINESAWFLLDADLLLVQNRRDEAISHLKSRKFQGKKDVSRLIRLAALKATENQKEAWGYLADAYNLDPTNIDIRSFRARLLENGGKPEQARTEYIAAVNLLPNNLYLNDQLADFYVRQKEYPLALDIWKTNLSTPSLDSIWVKSYFWSKVIQPIGFQWTQEKIPAGALEPLISYYIHLKPDQYWDKTAFSSLADGSKFLKKEQSTFWLRLLQDLKDHNEKEALALLSYNPFATTSWDPDLEKALVYALNYRMHGRFVPRHDETVKVNENDDAQLIANEKRHLIKQLINLVAEVQDNQSEVIISQDLHDLLMSDEIYTALFLSAEWPEAALQFNASEVVSSNLPEWIVTGLVQAINKNRGTQQAIDFAVKQKSSPSLKLQIADLYASLGNIEKSIEELKTLVGMEGNIGSQAAQKLAQLYVEQKDYQSANEVILKNPSSFQTIQGQELQARIAVYLNDTETADQIYSSIEKNSPEARSYLAKKAYAEKNWQRARELTEQLIKDYPENEQLKENLKKIVLQEKQAKK